jgi:hypothetical protein
MFRTRVADKIKTDVLWPIRFFSDNRAVYEIMSKNMVEPERPQMTIWRLVACWISKVTRVQVNATQPHARTLTHTHARPHTQMSKTY